MDVWGNAGADAWDAGDAWQSPPPLQLEWLPQQEQDKKTPSMWQLLAESGIPECMHEAFASFTPQEFGCVATDLANLEGFLDTLDFPAEPSRVLVTSRIRLLWKKCQGMSDPVSSSVLPGPAPQPQHVQDSGWVEMFPEKLGTDAVRAMIQRFKARYPSECLSPELMPSPRLLALVAKQLQDRSWRYIPWKLRLSEEQHEQQSMRRPSKAPRLESLLFDDVPTREIPGPSIGKCLMQELLNLQAYAIALCGGAHLHTLKEMNRRFLNRCYERYPAESFLRGPTVEEAQLADQRLWHQIALLCNEEQWSMDEAIHEVVVVRSELQTLLMPRPVLPKSLLQDGKGRAFRKGFGKGGGQKGNGKGSLKGGDKGDDKGKDGFMVAGLRVGLWYNQGNQRRNLCKDYQLGNCARDKCRFGHGCGVIVGKGRLCLGAHTPAEHKKHQETPH